MKIRFNGVIEKRKSGCNCAKSKTETGFVSSKSYYLPSGLSKRFFRGKIEEVSDEDGYFLLDYKYQIGGKTKNVFDRV